MRRRWQWASGVDDLKSLKDIADLFGAPVALVAFLIGLYTKKIVWGWQYDRCDNNLSTCQTLATTRADKQEAELERMRAQREGRPHDPH